MQGILITMLKLSIRRFDIQLLSTWCTHSSLIMPLSILILLVVILLKKHNLHWYWLSWVDLHITGGLTSANDIVLQPFGLGRVSREWRLIDIWIFFYVLHFTLVLCIVSLIRKHSFLLEESHTRINWHTKGWHSYKYTRCIQGGWSGQKLL